MNQTLILAAAVAALPLAAPAHEGHDHGTTVGNLTVTGAYARSTNPKVGAAFMVIENAGSTDCTLTAVSAPEVTERAEMHTHREENGVMSMVQVESITIPAGGSHALERGADHVMLMDTATPLAEGDEVAMTLDFGDCGQVPLTVKVDNAAGMPASHGGAADAPEAGNGHSN
ncbi:MULTISPECIES: copper chaperone PCu(A)C [unclassified Paracoccus (in: a-proteobacteria)]|uniref:copper chaperone PCu(A)C n=1 Tax=unclassified Paracoccus (in: a-proteobacteria) TaxID=2688777 RepID=UPI00160116F5|nr:MULTISPECIES: copper chaperone PCu(A)C [unclassified Paracoccus (in: a-proteobacteria)]MBB1492878.1 copper chaperone PCu(A)C [Paracoccus sp. MC1854]MBB1499413.1 copper chaperone PCu(A)C [Paracoccus sp. MC1862]QQO45370.1 copper chaperone PCu(A)C [Paracoccus sp. MC1862]